MYVTLHLTSFPNFFFATTGLNTGITFQLPQCNISFDVTLLYVLKYNIFYCSLQILDDWSVGKKLICLPRISLLPKKISRKTLRFQRKKTSLRGSSHLLYQPRKKNFTSMCASLRKRNSAGGQHSRVTMQKNCIYKPKCVSFTSKQSTLY